MKIKLGFYLTHKSELRAEEEQRDNVLSVAVRNTQHRRAGSHTHSALATYIAGHHSRLLIEDVIPLGQAEAWTSLDVGPGLFWKAPVRCK